MEEFVGSLWHRFITRVAEPEYLEAAVELAEVEAMAGVLFRALGGDPGLRVAPAAAQSHGAHRAWLQRLAGSGERTAQASLDLQTLALPPRLAVFPARALNRDLYLWLIALAAALPTTSASTPDWLTVNQQACRAVLDRYPGLLPRYRRLIAAWRAGRPSKVRLPSDVAAQESALQQALDTPGSVAALPPCRWPPPPVPLWLRFAPEAVARTAGIHTEEEHDSATGDSSRESDRQRRRAERVALPEGRDGFLLPFRAESLLSWAEYVRVHRPQDDDDNPDASRAAQDMDTLAVTRGGSAPASRVRFDLDLPSEAADDHLLGPGILIPEWHWKRRTRLPDHCRIQPMSAREAPTCALPERLRRDARRLRTQFAALTPTRRWLRNQPQGEEIDLDACVRTQADRHAGLSGLENGVYRTRQRRERDLACLVLADLSLSTDAWVGSHARVIDVIRDSLMLFAEALSATGDPFGLYGFSSLRRDNVRFHSIKEFGEPHDTRTLGRIAALKPGYYTRMGAAIRFASRVLAEQRQTLRLLLILSDGKPNDQDYYEGRYGIEDTRMSLLEARRQGLRPFCVTIDREAASYLPHLFGPDGYLIVRRPEELPRRLPALYAQLTGAD